MPDNKRARANFSVPVNGNNIIPHCSLLVFDSPQQNKKVKKDPFDGSCDISKMLQETNQLVENHSQPHFSQQQYTMAVTMSPPRKPSKTESQSTVNRARQRIKRNKPTITSPIADCSSTHLPIQRVSPNNFTSNFQSNLLPLIQSNNVNRIPTDPNMFLSSPIHNCSLSQNTEIREEDSLIFSTIDNKGSLSNSFLEDMSSSILYIVTGRRNEKVEGNQILNCNTKKHVESAVKFSPWDVSENGLSLKSSSCFLPTVCNKYSSFQSGTGETGIPKMESIVTCEVNSHRIHMLPSIASLLDGKLN